MESIEQEFVEMMRRCRDELKHLRQQIDLLTPKAEAYDVLRDVLRSACRQPSTGVREDLVWRLDRRINELRTAKTEGSKTDA